MCFHVMITLGKALLGLKQFEEAEKAFQKVNELHPECEDTKTELLKTRYLALRELGYSFNEASKFAIETDSLASAMDRAMSESYPKDNLTSSGDSGYSSSRERLVRKGVKFTPNRFIRSQSRPPAKSRNKIDSLLNINTFRTGQKWTPSKRRSHSVDRLQRSPSPASNFDRHVPKNLFGYKG